MINSFVLYMSGIEAFHVLAHQIHGKNKSCMKTNVSLLQAAIGQLNICYRLIKLNISSREMKDPIIKTE